MAVDNGEDRGRILEKADETDSSNKPEGCYLPIGDVINVLKSIEDPRHRAIAYVMDETNDSGDMDFHSVLEGSVPREEVEDHISSLDIGFNDLGPILDELTTPYVDTAYQRSYLEERGNGIRIEGAWDRLGDEMVFTNRRVDAEVIDFLEDRRYDEDFVEKSELKEELIPILGLGFITNSALSIRNEEVLASNPPGRHDSRNNSEYALDITLSRLGNTRGNRFIKENKDGDERGYRSQLNPVQRGILSKMHPVEGDYDVRMTGNHRARIIPEDY